MFHDTSSPIVPPPLCNSYWFFPKVVTLLKATSPIHVMERPCGKKNFYTWFWPPSFSPSLFSLSRWEVWATRTSTSHPSLPPPCQTTCCPPISPTIHPPDPTTRWTPLPVQLHITPTRSRAWSCLACLVAKTERLCWTKMAARSAQMEARWPALCLW